MLAWVFLIIQLFFAVLIFFLTLAFITGAPFVPSSDKTARKMIEFAEIKPGLKIYDLGSGDGKLLMASAQRGAKAVGFEINPMIVLYASLRGFFSRYRPLVRTLWKNFWKADFHDADAVFVYLLPWRMKELEQKLLKELRPNTKIISNSFIFPNIPCIKKDTEAHVYLFRTPKNIAKS